MSGIRLRIREIEAFERPMRFARPFRFGLVTVDEAPQAFVRVVVEVEGAGTATGVTAEMMMPKWFDKNPAKSPQDTIANLKASLSEAARSYAQAGDWDTAFGHHARGFSAQKMWAVDHGLPGLVASFGPALIDKAVADALLKASGIGFAEGLRRNVFGIDARQTPDLAEDLIRSFLSGVHPVGDVLLRHTVGLLDSLDGAGGLEDEIRLANLRLFKIKIGGDVDADIARLAAIHDLLSRHVPDYRATLDANEQYDPQRLRVLLQAMSGGVLRAFRDHLLYIEQPFDRAGTFAAPLDDLSGEIPFIIDEADGDYDAFPRAVALGYRGVSSKACKGFYKSVLNAVRVSALNEAHQAKFFVSAEDLTCQAGLGIQQDTALVATLGLTHAERNGHHYVEGFGPAPDAEAARFAAAHPDLYRKQGGRVGLAFERGSLPTASLLSAPGFASGAEPDWSSLVPLAQHHRS
ncbi:enolase-like domain-containing protein [Microvirga lotononidis]|uniref:Enolase superfamily enzyme related to L-alanine-DL-glutamate epimerase n=1 Tax=Microvirga lotononidis TaxID=864069 RepID=I4YYJ0_9HYPH|nr:enolase [Microvirga lotononidis]EIM29032.1 enolase superfamily enzyme related to L-alanine-DL-glutamate epimerase [Microvirga lotononidis]WQO28878.1 enolase [Microvirga lotononidis]